MSNWLVKQLARVGLVGTQAESLATSLPADGGGVAILLVDDTPANLQVLMETLKPLGHKLLAAKDGPTALTVARRNRPALILLDVMMPGMDGFEVCRQLKEDPELKQSAVIFCSALDDTAAKVRGLQLGAVDFVTKPFEPEEVVARVGTHLAMQQLARSLAQRNHTLARELAVARADKQDALRRLDWALLGSSSVLRQLKALIASAASGSDAVLLRAKPDCGAEAVGRAIHAASARADRPFIAVDGARLSALTGAPGAPAFSRGGAEASRLELADGGILFIDHFDRLSDQEVQDLSACVEAAQVASDAGRTPAPDVQIIAVTALPEGTVLPFRVPVPLSEALSAQQIRIPLLSERRDDVLVLAEAVLQRQAQAMARSFAGFDLDSLKRLRAHPWPGNLRELEDVVVRSAATTAGDRVLIDPNLLQSGTPLGGYRLIRKLGAGGFGEVWEARHQLLARPAAVKLMLADSAADPEMLERFKREATATASLVSQHTVALYDFGVSEQGQFYYVMELLDGIDLEQLCDKFGPPPPERLARFLLHACRSLAEAHARGLVHRDIKPANLFACRLGFEVDVLKVLDFGLVRGTDPKLARLTQDDMVLGTPTFIAPEVASGNQPIEARTDIYSLAASAWSMCTGQDLFPADNPMAMLMGHIQQIPQPLIERAPQVPQALSDLVMAGLAKSPGDRPTAVEFARSLLAGGLPQAWTDRHRRQWWDEHRPARRG